MESAELSAIADFQLVYRALTDVERDRGGRYPPAQRGPAAAHRVCPKRAIISGAVARGITVIATNSDGDPERRAFLLGQLGAGATERIVDPGRNIVEARLSDPETGELVELSATQAVGRWYSRRR